MNYGIMADKNNPHVTCLNETELDGDVGNEELVIDGFHDIIRKDRTRHRGRVAIYVKRHQL